MGNDTDKNIPLGGLPESSQTVQADTLNAAPSQMNPKIMAGHDPFDEPLDLITEMDKERLVLDDVYFEAARNSVTVDGMKYSFLKPPYMNFDDQQRGKKRMRDAFNHKLFFLMYGYSGCGKTTLQTQFSEKFPNYVKYIGNFDRLAPIQLIVRMGEMVGIRLKQRGSEIDNLIKHLKQYPGTMFIFDNVSLMKPNAIEKLTNLRTINEDGNTAIMICGVQKLYDDLYCEKNYPLTCSITSRLDEYQLTGMRRKDAGNYLAMVSEIENIKLTYPAQQALIATALNQQIGGINAFTTIIGRCITMVRATYYTSGGRSFPDKTKCIRTVSPDGKSYPGAELIITPPVTPEPILIDEHVVSRMLSEYKSYFPREEVKGAPYEDNEPAYYTSSAG